MLIDRRRSLSFQTVPDFTSPDDRTNSITDDVSFGHKKAPDAGRTSAANHAKLSVVAVVMLATAACVFR